MVASVIPRSRQQDYLSGMEKYLTLGWGEHLVFKDSLQFLASSLETLASNLLRSGKDLFKQLGTSFQVNGAAHPHFDMLLGKGVFTYVHLDAWEKMNERALHTSRRLLLAHQ